MKRLLFIGVFFLLLTGCVKTERDEFNFGPSPGDFVKTVRIQAQVDLMQYMEKIMETFPPNPTRENINEMIELLVKYVGEDPEDEIIGE